jgi:hydrogenase maturation protein HypF
MAPLSNVIRSGTQNEWPPRDRADGSGARGACRLVMTGRVQGLGVRPAIYRLATELGLAGSVRNTARGVEIDIEGAEEALHEFVEALRDALPAAAHIASLVHEPLVASGQTSFQIVKEPTDGPLAARLPEDRAVCPDCLEEVFRLGDRRHRYPFTSCTRCGPRYTVIDAMPYERDQTTMAPFVFCDPCRDEYQRSGDRRFHAQTNACPTCGPRVWSVAGEAAAPQYGEDALCAAAAALAAGKIVALRGLGGYQLLVDATNDAAIERLRLRKGRPAKPLAVMVDSCPTAERLAYVDDTERGALTGPEGPIVLLRARSGGELAPAIHPHLDTVGLMLPTTPLHWLLARDFGRPLVCTSGNRDGDPLEFQVESAQKNIGGLCDLWLHHDREIARPIDDNVVRVIAGRVVTMRLGRGLAPLPLDLPKMQPTFATGGFLKAAAAWSNGAQAVLGPHVGDQQGLAARQRYVDLYQDAQQLYRFNPRQFVHDLHPEYFSTQWAQNQSGETVAVQHHHAHVVAGMLEHGWMDREVLGVAWDGTGYGTDRTIWGGEFLVSRAASFERVAHLRPFRLPGGEAAIEQPWRIAVAVAGQLSGNVDLVHWPGWQVSDGEIRAVRRIAANPRFSPITTSAGRLIDAAAALILGIDHAEYDGQAAMRLEAAADPHAYGEYELPLCDGQTGQLDWRPMFVRLMEDCRSGVEPGVMAMRFHRGLAGGIESVCRRRPELPVGLSGGVFQNRLLTELLVERLADGRQPLGLPGKIPPNDGGLAAGQLAIAAAIEGQTPCV